MLDFSQALKVLQRLRIMKLDFRFSSLIPECLKLLGDGMKENKKFTQLDFIFANNVVKDEGAKYLLESLREQKDLTKLVLNFADFKNKITDSTVKVLGEVLKEFKQLNSFTLILTDNQVTDTGVSPLFETFKSLTCLNTIALDFRGGYNFITDISMKKLHDSLVKGGSIKEFSLDLRGGNKISENGKQAISNLCKTMKISAPQINYF